MRDVRLGARFGARARRLRERGLVAPEERDVGAGAREIDGDRAPDPAARAGHDGDPSLHAGKAASCARALSTEAASETVIAFGRARDALEHRREDRRRSELDDEVERHPGERERDVVPAHFVRHRADQVRLDLLDAGVRLPIDVRDDGEAGRHDGRVAHVRCELVACRIHQRAVPGAGDVERHDALRARFARELAGDAHGGGVAADDDLPGSVEVRELHASGAARDGARDDAAQHVGLESEHRRHRALGAGRGAVHREPALVDQRERGLEGERSGERERAVLAERVARAGDGIEHVGQRHARARRS